MTNKNSDIEEFEEEIMVLEPDADILRALTQRDFAAFGLQDLAYIKIINSKKGRMFEVHAADGTQLMKTKRRMEAVFAVEEHSLIPVSVH